MKQMKCMKNCNSAGRSSADGVSRRGLINGGCASFVRKGQPRGAARV
jgi:hypothetical protein